MAHCSLILFLSCLHFSTPNIIRIFIISCVFIHSQNDKSKTKTRTYIYSMIVKNLVDPVGRSVFYTFWIHFCLENLVEKLKAFRLSNIYLQNYKHWIQRNSWVYFLLYVFFFLKITVVWIRSFYAFD